MRARLRSWWLKIKHYQVTYLVIAIFLVISIILIIEGYKFEWTGFNGNNKSGKTLWDWLQLLIIPLALAVIALIFQLANTRTERQIAKERYDQDQQIAKQRYEQDQQIALDKQREDLLQTYLDRMSELLLDKQLRTSEPDAEVRNVARARTLTVLSQLDADRKGNLIQFLSESKLIKIISLKGAEMNGAQLGFANLSHATLKAARLRSAKLYSANLSNANLNNANLPYANLNFANLSNADLSEANLGHANLSNADLSNANLRRTFLEGVDLTHANLRGTQITDRQLWEAKSLKGATMPDGSIHP